MKLIKILAYLISLLLIVSCATNTKDLNKVEKKVANQEEKIQPKQKQIKKDEITTTCTMREDIRKIVYDKKTFKNGCIVNYTKFEKTYTIAQSKKNPNYCNQIAERVLSNLQAAGFECQSDD